MYSIGSSDIMGCGSVALVFFRCKIRSKHIELNFSNSRYGNIYQ